VESSAEISGIRVLHDLPPVADSLQIASDDFVERRSFGACDLDDPVSRISEGHFGNDGSNVVSRDRLK
jgi:hypothetical protein